jgi:hypothetical protein
MDQAERHHEFVAHQPDDPKEAVGHMSWGAAARSRVVRIGDPAVVFEILPTSRAVENLRPSLKGTNAGKPVPAEWNTDAERITEVMTLIEMAKHRTPSIDAELARAAEKLARKMREAM